MKAEIITIGDEILIGQIVDTNSAWIGQQFSELGVKLHEIISVGDDAAQITDALNRAKTTSQIIAERIVRESKILLKYSAWNVSEIAYALGFTETTHFNNFFKKHVEISPLKFRNV